MSADRTINATLLKEVLGYAECYLEQLDYWYGMAKNRDVVRSTVLHRQSIMTLTVTTINL